MRLATAGAVVGCCLAAGAARADAGGLYVGATGGLTVSSYGQQAVNEAVVGTVASEGYTLKIGSASLTTAAPAASAVVGYMLTPYFGAEASYLYLNTQRYRDSGRETSTLSATTVPLNLAVNLTSRGPTLALVGVLPLTNGWQLDARVGAYEGSMHTEYWSMAGSYKNSGRESETSTSLMLNAGTAYTFADHWLVRLEYVYLNHLSEKLLGESYNTGLAMAGVTYWF